MRACTVVAKLIGSFIFAACSENKGANQLCNYSAAGLFLCFHICHSRCSHCVYQEMVYHNHSLYCSCRHVAGYVYIGR